MSLHGVDVTLPADAPSIISDYRTGLDANLEPRPFRHTGIDIAGTDDRTPVIAAMDGTVDEAGYLKSGGHRVVLHHATDDAGRDLLTAYFHLSRILVAPGNPVRRGDVLGLIGMTGTTSGSVPHLHYNVFAGAQLRQRHFLDYFYTRHVNPHLYWHDGPGRVTLFRPDRTYPNRLGATFPVPGRADEDFFQRIVERLL
jgi:murein DD-endopeptidase MepM/ murein hydrolase activator NlpD